MTDEKPAGIEALWTLLAAHGFRRVYGMKRAGVKVIGSGPGRVVVSEGAHSLLLGYIEAWEFIQFRFPSPAPSAADWESHKCGYWTQPAENYTAIPF